MSEDRYAAQREQMVERQLVARGLADARVLAAMRAVPRHRFVDARDIDEAYSDHPLPIGAGQTISQPFMVALMVELCELTPSSRVLEIGAGSGYQSAVLAELAGEVYALELLPELTERAHGVLVELGLDGVVLDCADGSDGWPEHAPYDAIVVAAGARKVPPALLEQLADGGRLVVPIGPRGLQTLEIHRRHGTTFQRSEDTACRFVELRGACGWSP